MSQHLHQGFIWDCESIDKRIRNLEAERDALKAELDKLRIVDKYRTSPTPWLSAELPRMEAEIDRLKAELEDRDRKLGACIAQGIGITIDRDKWRDVAKGLASGLRSHDDLSRINRQALAAYDSLAGEGNKNNERV